MAFSVVTGAFPTDTPATLGDQAVAPLSVTHKDVDMRLKATAGTGTFLLLGYDDGEWWPVQNTASTIDSTVHGGKICDRLTPGNDYTHYCIWRVSGTPTLTVQYLKTGNFRV